MADSTESKSSSPASTRTTCFGLTTQDRLKLVSNLAIPLIIGVFTIIISVHQQNVAQNNRKKDAAEAAVVRLNDIEQAKAQREEDRETARIQREEDKNLSRLQWEEDRNLSRRRQDEDREIARRQRHEDKETARLQRELDLKIALDKRQLEYELTEKQLTLNQRQRAHEVEIAQQNYWNTLMLVEDRRKENTLVNYQRQLAKLLLYNNSQFSITQNTFELILKMRTRSALRLLDPKRRTILVHTLWQAGLLNEPWIKDKSPLYRVNCSEVDFGVPYTVDHQFDPILVKYKYLHIRRADVRYATFRFTSIQIASASFHYSNLDYTDWSFAQLSYFEFDHDMTLNHAVFAQSTVEGVVFEGITMNAVSFVNNTLCKYCTFKKTSLRHARLNHSTFHHGRFLLTSLADANMSYGIFWDAIFEHSNLDRVDLSGADLSGSTFRNVSMVNCIIRNTKQIETRFIDTYPQTFTGYKGN